MRKFIILALLIGLAFAQKPTTRKILDADWIRVLSANGQGFDYTRSQFLNADMTKTNTYTSGAFSLKIIDTFTELGASAHKSINVDLTYTPKIAGVSSAGAAAPVGIASKVTLTTGMTRNSASSNYQGLAWAVQGQIHTPTGATYAGEAATDPGMIMAGLRGVLTDAGTSTYTNGTFTGAYLESQVSQDVTVGDFRHFLLWCRNQGSGTATKIDAAIYIDEGDAWTNTIQTGIDINNTVKGMDIMATTTGIDFSSSMTQEIIGQNDETWENSDNGYWTTGGGIKASGESFFTNNAAVVTFGAVGTDADVVLAFDAVTNQGSITYMEDEDRFDFDNDVNIAGRVTANELRVTNATSTDVSALPIYVSETLSGTFGATTPAYGMTVYSKLLGANLSATDAYESAITGLYGITGTNASVYPKASVLGWIMDNTTTADGAFIALIDGDTQITQAGAAFGVRHLNSTPNSGFDYGLDLYGAAIRAYDAVSYRTADIRLSDSSIISGEVTNGATLNTDTGVTNINYAGALNRTVVTLTAHAMDITDTGGANGGHGALKVLDFPEGYVRIEGVIGDIEITGKSGGVSATAVFDMAMGTATTLTDAATLGNANVTIVAKVDGDLIASVDTIDLVDITSQDEDGTSGSTDVWLCVAVEDASISSTGTMIMSGTIVITWYNLGDY